MTPEERAAWFAYLDKRIPGLHAMGKPAPIEGEQSGVGSIARNLAMSKYPGRRSREQADREFFEELRRKREEDG